MNSIIYNYNTTIDEFKNSLRNSSEISIDVLISLLSRIESILYIFDLRFRDIGYGKKFLMLLLNFNDTQFGIAKLESAAQPEVVADYLTYLKKQETDLVSKIQDFISRKELEFPTVKKKNIISVEKYCSKAAKYLKKIEEYVGQQSNDIEADADEIFKVLNKFNKYIQASSLLNFVEDDKPGILKTSLKILDDIIRYENLISAHYSYYKKNIETVEDLIDKLEHEKMGLVDEFESVKYILLDNCKLMVNRLNELEINTFTNQLNGTEAH